MRRFSWVDTIEAIRALPQEVQDWIAELETRSDPAGDLRARRVAEDRVEQLTALVAELQEELRLLKKDPT